MYLHVIRISYYSMLLLHFLCNWIKFVFICLDICIAKIIYFVWSRNFLNFLKTVNTVQIDAHWCVYLEILIKCYSNSFLFIWILRLWALLLRFYFAIDRYQTAKCHNDWNWKQIRALHNMLVCWDWRLQVAL